MINQTKIEAAVQAACNVFDDNNIKNRKKKDDNAIQEFIFSKTKFLEPIEGYANRTESVATDKLKFIMCSMTIHLFILLGIYISNESNEKGIDSIYLLISFVTFSMSLIIICHPKFAKKEVTLELIKELMTVETVSETTRIYITKLIDQTPPDTNPYLILKVIYERDIAMYSDEVATTPAADDSHHVTEGQPS